MERSADRAGAEPRDVEVVRGKQRGVFGLFESMLVVSWVYPRQDEAQLAGVLGHEIGHVQQKHHLKLLQ